MKNAADKGCVGAVLYPDPQEFPMLQTTDRIISNAKRVSGDPQTPGWPDVSGMYITTCCSYYPGCT